MDIKDCEVGMAVRCKGDRTDSRDRKTIVCGIIQAVDKNVVDVGFGFFTKSEHDWCDPLTLEALPKFQRPCRTPEQVPPAPADAKIMVAAMTPDNELLALGFCGDAVIGQVYGRFKRDYNVPADVSWGIHSDHAEVARWLGYRTVQVYVASAIREGDGGTIELVPCFSSKPPYQELEGPWCVEKENNG